MNAAAQTIQGFNSVRVITLSVIGIALLGAFAFLSVRLTSPVLSPLYSNLTLEDSSTIVTELGALGIDFDIGSNGSQILVKSSDVLRVRMALAQKGLPSKGSIVGYEIFDKDTALGTSNFVLNVNLLRALEGELSRTISSLSSIKSARVHLVMPKKEIFQRGKVEPSASVVLTLNNLTKVPKNEAMSVRHLVSAAVPGLKPSRVTVVDSSGKMLARSEAEEEEDEYTIMSASTSDEFRANFENRLKKTIENIIEQAVGIGRVHAEVSAEIAFDRVITNSEIYDPDGQVARSVQSSTETLSSSEGGADTVSVANELPNAEAADAGNGGASNNVEKVDEVTNFEISKTIKNHISEVGGIKKLSVAVVVDGKYEKDGDGKRLYKPRSDEEIEQIRSLVQSAIGYNEERGDTVNITNMKFSQDTELYITDEGALDWLKRDLDSILKTVVVGIVAILAIMLVIRPLVNRAFDVSPGDIVEEDMIAPPTMEMPQAPQATPDFDMMQSKAGSPTAKVNEIAKAHPEETLSVVRSWLAQG